MTNIVASIEAPGRVYHLWRPSFPAVHPVWVIRQQRMPDGSTQDEIVATLDDETAARAWVQQEIAGLPTPIPPCPVCRMQKVQISGRVLGRVVTECGIRQYDQPEAVEWDDYPTCPICRGQRRDLYVDGYGRVRPAERKEAT